MNGLVDGFSRPSSNHLFIHQSVHPSPYPLASV
jgi:hypothetical protein